MRQERPDDRVLPIAKSDLLGSPALADGLLALNNDHAVELSWLDPGRLVELVGKAFAARRIGPSEAFLLAFDQDADYDSANFQWFRSRRKRFVYVDRVVVAAAARGRGHGRRLYRDLFDLASTAGHDLIACEVNAEPPNPGSDAFHRSLGFEPVGTASTPDGRKTVRYLERRLDPTG